jgi:hypothetical protein
MAMRMRAAYRTTVPGAVVARQIARAALTRTPIWTPTRTQGAASVLAIVAFRNWRARTLAYGSSVILPKDRDSRFITIRRGGTLTDSDHRLLALWAAACAEHVLHLFELVQPSDPRPRQADEQIRAWTHGEISMSECRAAGDHAMAAARELSGAPRYAAFAAGQAAVVAHVAAHERGAAAYAIKAARAAAAGCEEHADRLECRGGERRPHRRSWTSWTSPVAKIAPIPYKTCRRVWWRLVPRTFDVWSG